jgi:hypothetical protein
MNHLFRRIVYIFLGISLVACSGPAISPTTAITTSPSNTASPSSIPTVTEENPSKATPELVKNTDTIAPSFTPATVHTITFTASPTSTVTQTAIFNPAAIRTVTPAPAAKCPTPSSEKMPTSEIVTSLGLLKPKDVLVILNQYGAGPIYAEYSTELKKGNDVDRGSLRFSDYRDMTNDGVKELIANYSGELIIIGCQDGQYTLLSMRQADGAQWLPYILDVSDANRNGMPEAFLYLGGTEGGGSFYQVIEWDGQKFQDLLVPIEKENEDYAHDDLFVEGGAGSNLKHTDIDHDGVEEYIATIGIPAGEGYQYNIPWRKETQIYKWNGQQFVFFRRTFTAPQYRFQAVQDGDLATLAGEYDLALDFYQRAIFDDKLEWWSHARMEFVMKNFLLSLWQSDDPTPVPPVPDPKEYDNLAAYARYRIILLHLARGWVSDAKVVYDTLQKKYPEGKPGHDYAVLAETVWTEFELSKDLGKACAKGIEFASNHSEEIYSYIGGSNAPGHHGIKYNEHHEYICPFQ